MSKPITALAILQLVEAGKLELDSPVQHYLPEFRIADSIGSAKITVRQFLLHTSGIPATACDTRAVADTGAVYCRAANGRARPTGRVALCELQRQLHGGRYDNSTLLSSQGITAMQTPGVTIGTGQHGYGLGWRVGSFAGVSAIYHPGDSYNGHTLMLIEPRATVLRLKLELA